MFNMTSLKGNNMVNGNMLILVTNDRNIIYFTQCRHFFQ